MWRSPAPMAAARTSAATAASHSTSDTGEEQAGIQKPRSSRPACELSPAHLAALERADVFHKLNAWATSSPLLNGGIVVGVSAMTVGVLVLLLLISFQPPVACVTSPRGTREVSMVRVSAFVLLAVFLASAWPIYMLSQLYTSRQELMAIDKENRSA